MFDSLLMLAHVLISLFLVVVILLQRSEGGIGALGGGGGGAQSLMGASGAGSALSKATRWLFIAFLVSSMTLSISAHKDAQSAKTLTDIENTEPVAPVPSELPAE